MQAILRVVLLRPNHRLQAVSYFQVITRQKEAGLER